MIGVIASCCCEVGSCICQRPVCDEGYPPALYPSVGYPQFIDPPTQVYAGTFWHAWWNAIHIDATVGVDITIEITPPTGPVKKIHVYGDLPLVGTNAGPGHIEVDGTEYSLAICGPFPSGIMSDGTGTQAELDAVTASNDNDPEWWARLNRYDIPQWHGNLSVEVDNGTPFSANVTINYPNVIIGNATSAGAWQIGALTAAYGLDMCIWEVTAIPEMLDVIGKLGSLAKVWMTATGDPDSRLCPTFCPRYWQLRVLRSVSEEIAPGEVLRFGETQTIVQNGTETIGGLTWSYNVSISMTPQDWCLATDQCGCAQSYSEQSLCVLDADITIPFEPDCNPGIGANMTTTLVMGLCGRFDVVHSPVWQQLDIDPNIGGYLGCRPFEAAMPDAGHATKPYRNEWNVVLNPDSSIPGADGYLKRKLIPPATPQLPTVGTPPCNGCIDVTLTDPAANYFCIGISYDVINQFGRCGMFMFDTACGIGYSGVAPCNNLSFSMYLCGPWTAIWNPYVDCVPDGSYTLCCTPPTPPCGGGATVSFSVGSYP